MKKFRKKISLIGLSFAICVCAGITAFLNLKTPTTANAASNFMVYTPEIELKDAQTNTKPFPKLTVSVNLGSFAANYNIGSKRTETVYSSFTLYGNKINLERTTKSIYYVDIGLTKKTISKDSLNSTNFLKFEKENGFMNFIKGSNIDGTSRLYKSYKKPVTDPADITEYNGPYLESEIAPDSGFYETTPAAESGIVRFEFDLYQYYEGINDDKKPYFDWVSYIEKNLNFYVVLVEEQLIAEEVYRGGSTLDYNYSSNYVIHNSNIETVNLKSLIVEELTRGAPRDNSYTYISNMIEWAGIVAPQEGTKVPVDVIYREMTGITTYKECRKTFNMAFEDSFSNISVSYAINKNLGVSSYTDFNASWRDVEVLDSGIVNLNSERVIYQAVGYTYNYDFDLQKMFVTVEYTDFFAKDFAIELRSNDPLDDAAIYIYSTDIKSDKTTTILTFDFRAIEEQLYNQKGWIVSLSQGDLDCQHSSLVKRNLTADNLTLSVATDKQGLLSEASISIIAEIIEDVDVTVTYEYKGLYLDANSNVCKKTITSTPSTMKYSEVISMSSNNFYVYYKDTIDSAVSLDILSDCEYMSYGGVQRTTVEKGVEYKFVVSYNYQMIVKVIHPDGNVTYVQADTLDRNAHFLESLNITIPEGERLENILVSPAECLTLSVNQENYEDSTIFVTCNMFEDNIGVVELVTTDEFFVKVSYLEQFKQTPFAYPRIKSGKAKVADIPTDGTSYTEFLKKFLNVNSLQCLRSNVESLDVTYNGKDTYKFVLKYTFCSLRKIDYNGNISEIKVPLTKYKDWAQSMGQDWSILFLNMPNTTYFEYSSVELPNGEVVNADNLYGYFAVAIFKEKVTDLNYYFKGYSGDGVVSMFESTQASGGAMYRRLASIVNNTKFSIFDIAYYPALAFCEFINSDNAMYHNYFFYLDCKVDPNKSYISNGRADSADDTDGAFGNVMQDTADKVGKVFEDIFKKDDGKLKWYTWLLIGFASLLSLAIFIRIIRKK